MVSYGYSSLIYLFLGNKVIFVQQDVNWEVGQYVVVITSAYRDNTNDQNEVRQIVAVNGKYFYVHRALTHFHLLCSK